MISLENPEVRAVLGIEFDDILQNPIPSVEADFNLCWVFSGPQRDWFTAGKDGVHQTRNRFETGIAISRMVAAKKLEKEVPDLSPDELKEYAPSLLFNGWMDQNVQIEKLRTDSYFEVVYGFPKERIVIALEQNTVENTKDQIANVSKGHIPTSGRIALISDGYHGPRLLRYFENDDSPIDPNRVVFVPAQPLYMPPLLVVSEISKIIGYSNNHDIPLYKGSTMR